MTVVSNTTPLRYLVVLGHADLLKALFGHILIPPAVLAELQRTGTPRVVREWASALPEWVEVRSPALVDPNISLGAGEREAIALSQEVNADQLLVDESLARRAASQRGIRVAGTLRILEAAAEHGLIELAPAIARLRQTNFYVSDTVLDRLLQRDAQRRSRNKE
jgi:predicted nucleic acid-binding protein